jgi:hypothetical protein
MRGPSRGVATLRDPWCSPARLAQGRRGQSPSAPVPTGNAATGRGLLRRDAERFGMGPSVVLGQTSVRRPGRYATVRRQISQRVTGGWVTVTGKRREGDLLICLYDACPAGMILP